MPSPPAFQPLTGIYEPSGIQQLPDGRFLVVEDEKDQPLSLVTIQLNGQVSSTTLDTDIKDGDKGFRKLNDLEGITLDRLGNLYAITSHSRDGDGDNKKSRNKLVRFRIEGNQIVDPGVVKDLKPALLAMHPVLADAAKIHDVKNDDGLNIEALEITPDQNHLLIGFRSPLLDNQALIARVDNVAAVFDADVAPHVADTLITLDLDGHGIRGLAYLPGLNGYLLISGPASRAPEPFRLWFWNGQPNQPAQRASVPGLSGFEHAEGVCGAVIDGKHKVIFVSDDGNKKADRFAQFLMLDPAQLHIEPTRQK